MLSTPPNAAVQGPHANACDLALYPSRSAAIGCYALPLSLITMIAMRHMKLASCTEKKVKRTETIASV
jgi:hypothetical protein